MLVAGVVLGVVLGPAVLGRFAPDLYDPLFENTGDLSDVREARAALADLDTGEINIAQTDQAKAAIEAFDQANQLRQQRIEAVREKFKLIGEVDGSTATARDEQIATIKAEQEMDVARLQQRLIGIKQETRDAMLFSVAQAERKVQDRREAHHDKLLAMATVMLLLIVVLHTAEAILSPQRNEIEEGRAILPPVLSRLITVRYALMSGWLMLMLAQPIWLKAIGQVLWFGVLLLAVVLLAGLVPLGKRA